MTESIITIYEAARQNARYRRSLAPDEAQVDVNPLRLGEKSIVDLAEILQGTNDVKVVDFIKEWTEARLRWMPETRQTLFDIARQGVAYRRAAQ